MGVAHRQTVALRTKLAKIHCNKWVWARPNLEQLSEWEQNVQHTKPPSKSLVILEKNSRQTWCSVELPRLVLGIGQSVAPPGYGPQVSVLSICQGTAPPTNLEDQCLLLGASGRCHVGERVQKITSWVCRLGFPLDQQNKRVPGPSIVP